MTTKIAEILEDQTTLALHPIKLETQKAELEAASELAKFRSNLTKQQVEQMQDEKVKKVRKDKVELIKQAADLEKTIQGLQPNSLAFKLAVAELEAMAEEAGLEGWAFVTA